MNKNIYTVGDKVTFPATVEAVNANDQPVTVPAGSNGTVEKVINASALYVKVNGRKVVVWYDEVTKR